MAHITHKDEQQAPTLDELARGDDVRQQREYSERKLASNRAMRRGYSRVKFADSKPGDHTHNRPSSLRKDTKVRWRLDLSEHTFLLVPHGRAVVLDAHGYVDVRMTLAVLTHMRHIIASNREYKHPAE